MTTTNYALIKPLNGADTDNWGLDLNTSLDMIDDITGRTNRTFSNSIASPTGTTSATYVMMGIGGTWAITPRYRAGANCKVKLRIDFGTINTTTMQNNTFKMMYGTGTAPVNGAAGTGTNALGSRTFTISNYPSISIFSVSRYAEITGLTNGTAYWFDIAMQTTGGTASIQDIVVLAEEF